ncbi:hypothetical protein KN1_22790 [Stygiolobus caldivivus]|uniref:DUF3211 domain-containing protein n=2 Tax=Stygiolobus caldivivus TaxID=2824673 RepID=A0A8D5ZK85_9CREN|nr:hypothetical protein KN1_22790 [Stygiolobus caldivivus]
MKLEKEVKISHEIDVVLRILSDPSFLIPRIFPNVTSIKVHEDTFDVEGKLVVTSYHVSGRVFVGSSEIRYVYDSDKGGGVLRINKVNDNTIRITLEHDGTLLARLGYPAVNSNLNKLEKNLDEEIRLERIKRKI